VQVITLRFLCLRHPAHERPSSISMLPSIIINRVTSAMMNEASHVPSPSPAPTTTAAVVDITSSLAAPTTLSSLPIPSLPMSSVTTMSQQSLSAPPPSSSTTATSSTSTTGSLPIGTSPVPKKKRMVKKKKPKLPASEVYSSTMVSP
jgi:hypothetical protein